MLKLVSRRLMPALISVLLKLSLRKMKKMVTVCSKTRSAVGKLLQHVQKELKRLTLISNIH